MTKTNLTVAAGRCLCGAVSFTLNLPSIWVAHCHCTMCQRAHGAAFVTWVGMAENKVQIDDAQLQLRWYQSSPEAQRAFCACCGSPLFFRSAQWPGEIHVARASIAGELDRLPQMHGYYDTHVAWFEVQDQLPKRSAP